ncbi:hypothetical protein BDR04DRAFT_1122208 [Suillus decipiens]|nr:hypothetical protein BDR04DRAFT_1122208 [Suillus decipiens]
MVQDHFEQLLLGAMLQPGPAVTSQVDGEPCLNQILAVKAHVEHLKEKIQMATEATNTISQLEGPMFQLDLDMIRYNEALHKWMVATHEDSLLKKFPCGPEHLLEKASVILDLDSCIILWYPPDAISLWIQAKMEEATIGIGSLLKKSMTSGPDTQWRTFTENFHASDQHQLTPGCISLAPCWFLQS